MSKIDINKSWKYDAAPESTSHIKLKINTIYLLEVSL